MVYNLFLKFTLGIGFQFESSFDLLLNFTFGIGFQFGSSFGDVPFDDDGALVVESTVPFESTAPIASLTLTVDFFESIIPRVKIMVHSRMPMIIEATISFFANFETFFGILLVSMVSTKLNSMYSVIVKIFDLKKKHSIVYD